MFGASRFSLFAQLGRPKNARYRSFAEARAYVHELGFTRWKEWTHWVRTSKRPVDIPTDPRHAYRDSGWKSGPDWLGYTKEPVRVRKTEKFDQLELDAVCIVSKANVKFLAYPNKPLLSSFPINLVSE